MAQNRPPPMKLYIMSDAIKVVKSLCTAQKEKEKGVSGASKLIIMIFFFISFFFFAALVLLLI